MRPFIGKAAGLPRPLQLRPLRSGGQLSLNLGYLAPRAAFAEATVRQQLLDRATGIFSTLSTKTLNGFPGTSILKLNDPTIATGFRDLLVEILAIGGKPAG